MARHQNGLSPCNLLLIIQMLVFKLIVLPLSSTFCEDSFLLWITLIGFKQLACISHSIEGPMSKLVDTDDGIISAYHSGAQRSGNSSVQRTFVPRDHNCSCQTSSALICNVVNLPHQFNCSCPKIHIS